MFRILAYQWVRIKRALRLAYSHGLEVDFEHVELACTRVKVNLTAIPNKQLKSAFTLRRQ